MSRFYVSTECVYKGKIILRGQEAHHARDVMRLKAGDNIVVFDGTGREYSGPIEKVTKEELVARIDGTIERQGDKCRLTLVQAIPKLNKMDTIVEKATELGVESIVPVVTARTIVAADASSASSKIERWNKIAVCAAKQCGRVTIPKINEILKFKDSLLRVKNYESAIIACLCEATQGIRKILKDSKAKSVVVFIGPEGDFTEGEVDAARQLGAVPVSLGKEVLRSDTAAISVLSILNYELRWGDGD